MKQEDWINRIKESADQLEIPKSLKPQQITERIGRRRPLKKHRIYQYGYFAAAILFVVCIYTTAIKKPINTGIDKNLATESLETHQIKEQVLEDRTDEITKLIANNYEQIFEVIPEAEHGEMWLMGDQKLDSLSNDVRGLPVPETMPMEKQSNFSKTNTQVQGVDEGDIVKTDGRYIYTSGRMGTKQLAIIEVNGSTMEKKSAITLLENRGSLREFYVDGDYLSIVSEIINPRRRAKESDRMTASYDMLLLDLKVVVDTYDITDKRAPRLLGSMIQDGSYMGSRKVGDYLYLFSNYWADGNGNVNDIDQYIPFVDGEILPCNRIYLPDGCRGNNMVVFSSLSMKEPDKTVDQKAILSSGTQFYVSNENIYVGESEWDDHASLNNSTVLVKLSYKDGIIKAVAQGNIDGVLNNQFSMDEYKGYLRAVTTVSYNSGEDTNTLSILDKDLKVVGKIEDLAPNERIYSARFLGDAGYFVTFRNMDPLFSVDLSDPANPKVLGELKISGFSNYLHFYSDSLLLGIGEEVDPNTGEREGIKLSMFDISNPSDVKETHKMVLKEYENSEAFYNHKAVMIDTKENIFGFLAEGNNGENRKWITNYLVYSYDTEKGFEESLNVQTNIGRHAYGETARGIYINQIVYIVEGNRITAFDRNNGRQMALLSY